jgi:hypothetical protein
VPRRLVLAALLKPGRTWAWAMVEGLSPDVFRDRYRRAVVLTDMHRNRRPVDPLTADWELASWLGSTSRAAAAALLA